MHRSTEPLAAALDELTPRDDTEDGDLRRTRALLTDGDPWDRTTPLHATASALVADPRTGRVLLRRHPRQRAWLQIGGHADPGEDDPLAIALREGREETGLADLRPWPARHVAHLVIVDVAAGPAEPAHEHADLRYLLATDTPEHARPETPEAPLRWLALDEARAVVAEANLHRTLDRLAEAAGWDD